MLQLKAAEKSKTHIYVQ